MAQNRTNRCFVSNMYEILNAYKYFRILLHFGNTVEDVSWNRTLAFKTFKDWYCVYSFIAPLDANEKDNELNWRWQLFFLNVFDTLVHLLEI